MSTQRKLPETGQTVAYTRNFLLSGGSRLASCRGILGERHSEANKDWPLYEVKWFKGCYAGQSTFVNLHNLCTTRSVAFVEI